MNLFRRYEGMVVSYAGSDTKGALWARLLIALKDIMWFTSFIPTC